MPAKASTRLPESDATDASSGLRRARSTGLRRAAISAATAPAAAPLPTPTSASVRANGGRSGARKGPAGITRPLPRPRPLSITISDTSLTTDGFWKPSSIRMTDALSERASGRPSARSRETPPDRDVYFPAIPAAEHHRRLAEIAQQFCQRQHRRRLAGAADMIIADAEHGDARLQTFALPAL